MENKPTINDFSAFIKYLVELGGVYYVDDDSYIRTTVNDEPVGVIVNKKPLPIVVYQENMKMGDYVILNPFSDSLGHNPEKFWLFRSRSVLVEKLVMECVRKIITLGIAAKDTKDDNEESNYAAMEYVTPYLDDVTTTTLKKLDKFKKGDLLDIFYSSKQRTAQLQTKIYYEDFCKNFKPRVGKKTWQFFRKVLEQLFKTSAFEELYTYKSGMIGMQECDANLNILYKICKAIEEPVKVLLGKDLDVKTFTKHMNNLEEYHKLSRWLVGSSSKKVEKEEKLDKPPWEESTLPASKMPSGVPNIPQPKVIRNRSESLIPSYGNQDGSQVPDYRGSTPNSETITYAGQSSSIHYANNSTVPTYQSTSAWGGSAIIRP